MPKLSVITACYNHGKYLIESADSVLRQTEPDVELVIINDASTDDSLAIAMGLASMDQRIRVLSNPENRGLAASQNAGITAARAPWVLKVDADDYIHPRYVEEILAAAAADPRRNVIFSPCQHVGARTDVYTYLPFNPARMIDYLQIPGPAAFQKAVWAAVGGYDETMRSAEDWDLYVRAQLVVGLVPFQLSSPRWYYRQHDGQRASAEGMRKLKELKAYWRGHTRENIGTRTWGAWCTERANAA